MGFKHSTLSLINALLVISSFCVALISANDTITPGQIIRDSETLSSNSNDFILGFFSPPNSTHRYVGIWYFSHDNLVWVANRDKPINDSSGVLTISQDGNLVILDGQKHVLWSSNVSYNGKNTTAHIQDSGNLVLQVFDENTGKKLIWQSFEHPADAAIPNMTISANRFTGKKIEFVSWKSFSDPSPGFFSASLERLVHAELFLWVNRTRPYWRTGPWNGRIFIGAPLMSTYLHGLSRRNQDDGTVYLTYSFLDSGILSLTPQGKLRLVRFYNKKKYLDVDLYPSDSCDHYGMCGEFGSCNGNRTRRCRCLSGFEPKVREEWNRQNWTSGCVRKSPLMCENLKNRSKKARAEDVFLRLQNMKVPDFAETSGVDTEDQCRTECFNNCSCLAYGFDDAGIGCMYWTKPLIDLQEFSYGGTDLYIRVPHSELGKGSDKSTIKRKIITMTVSVGIVILVAFVFLSVIYTYRSRSKIAHKQREIQSQRVNDTNNQLKLDEFSIFDFEEVASATNNFHLANILGKGGFGPVYKGILQDGQEIAVKRLSRASGQGQEEFMNEVLVISKLQHRNLVKLLGCCLEGDEKMLIYEFMSNKSLDAFLFDAIQRKCLDWRKRFNIIEGIARGLLYLHRDSRLKIIHRDLKASNILLDGEMNPKISDFGLARIFGASDEDMVNTKRVIGTYGYMSPEYAMEGLFSEKSDVYSFGVLLLEIVNGNRNNSYHTSYHTDQESFSLIGLAWRLWNEEKIISLVDPEIWDSCNGSQIMKCIHIGLLCVQEAAKERPSMTNVVMMLSENIHLPPPKQVASVHKHWVSCSESSNAMERQIDCHNYVTVTDIQSR
ncbi:hypothetical protein QN277_020109 [Acacia crassicarpa]|uniref:Receptor-like serine/threonine-protein kinase n=1 Tax=Acacia crassicarpa TaxID=499986 RepID=A0AAE1JNU7_9FABA|nr:hypothetical protein QN277_020109 [Acacia crassicarpa]